MSLPEAKLYATPQEVTTAWLEWSKMRRCSKCGNIFNWLNSFGAWQCSQHLGPVSYRTVEDRFGIKKRDYRYYNCCHKPPNTAHRHVNENIWATVRTTRPCVDVFPEERKVPGCVPCDHTEASHILDDGIRLKVPLISTSLDYAFAPEGGHKINDVIIYKGEERTIAQVYFDKSVDLQDVDEGRISARFLIWPDVKYKVAQGGFYEIADTKESYPVKILKKYIENGIIMIDYKIMNIGMHISTIAAMIPHMPGDPTSRPGWQFEKGDSGQALYPHIANTADRTNYIKQ